MPLAVYRREEMLRLMAASAARGTFAGEVYQSAAEIIADVERRGDAAVMDWAVRLDGVTVSPGAGTAPAAFGPHAMARAWNSLPAATARALSSAARQIKLFHRRSVEQGGSPRPWREECPGTPTSAGDGSSWGQEMRPIERVGIYVPGGRNPYPSTVLMTAIPARVAGVGRITAATPPRADGSVHPLVLAAAHAAEVDAVVGAGGPQAVAAMAFGTETVPRCDKIVGPGNAYVTAAKKIVAGRVGIDGFMGPSELAIIADCSADPRWLAADMLAQGEHGPDSPVWLITDNAGVIEAVSQEIRRAAGAEPEDRRLRGGGPSSRPGGAVIVTSLPEGVELANAIGPEHLQLNVAAPEALMPLVRNAGAVYAGPWAPTALGDYAAGPSHVLPTGGTARFAGGLGVADFLRAGTVYAGTPASFRRLAPAALHLARLEGFRHHARSLHIRLQAAERAGDGASAEGAPGTAPAEGGGGAAPAGAPGKAGGSACTGPAAAAAAPLNLNESWQSMPPEVLEEIHGQWRELPLHRYPPDGQLDLARRLEDEYGFPRGSVIVGSGADEILQMIALAAGGRVSRAVVLEPDFGIYGKAARLAGLPVTRIPFEPGAAAMPMPALLDGLAESRGPVLMFLSRPNNPTGALWPEEEIQQAADAMPAGSLLVLDEAYWEFAGVSGSLWARRRNDVAIVRTFSKALGLAGLRCGFASVPRPWKGPVEEVRMPYNVSTPALAAASTVLSHRGLMEARARETARRRDAVIRRLGRLEGLTVFPSAANFFLVSVRGGVAAAGALAAGLARRGIMVRTFPRPDCLAGCIRISMGSPEQIDCLEAALHELMPAILGGGGRRRKGGSCYG